MKLHAFLLGQTTKPTIDSGAIYEALVGDTKHAEALGYDGAWFAEHHFSNYAMVPNSLTLLAALARETQRIRLGTSIILLPLRNPIFVAEEIAMVDQLSGGRLDVGFGRGYQPYEFERLKIDFARAGDMLAEGIDALKHLFTRPDEAFASTHYAIPPLTITPACRTSPHPPLWLAAGSPQSIGMALDRDLNIVVNIGNNGPDLADKLIATFRGECARRGIDPATRRFALQTHGYLVESKADEDAIVRSGGHLHRVQVRLREVRQSIVGGVNDASGSEAGEPTLQGWSSASLIGSREHIERQVARYAGMGVTDLFVTYRFGELETAGTRRAMTVVAEAVQRFGRPAALARAS